MERIFLQTRRGDCADYAMLSACQHLGVDVNEKDNIYKDELSLQAVTDRLVEEGKIKRLVAIRASQSIDMWLNRGHNIVIGTGKMSWTSVSVPPFIQKFDGSVAHNAVIVVWKHPTLWKVKDSQGSKFADGGYWYMLKSDFSKIKRFRIEL